MEAVPSPVRLDQGECHGGAGPDVVGRPGTAHPPTGGVALVALSLRGGVMVTYGIVQHYKKKVPALKAAHAAA